MNKEQAIKILDKFTTEHKFLNIKHSDGLEEAIETLLTAYEKEKEKNKELTDEYLIQRNLINAEFLNENYISKDKIKAKIEELEKEKSKYTGYKGLEISRTGLINAQKLVLQELLEERK